MRAKLRIDLPDKACAKLAFVFMVENDRLPSGGNRRVQQLFEKCRVLLLRKCAKLFQRHAERFLHDLLLRRKRHLLRFHSGCAAQSLQPFLGCGGLLFLCLLPLTLRPILIFPMDLTQRFLGLSGKCIQCRF